MTSVRAAPDALDRDSVRPPGCIHVRPRRPQRLGDAGSSQRSGDDRVTGAVGDDLDLRSQPGEHLREHGRAQRPIGLGGRLVGAGT